jgi:hypothetical protein
MQTPHRASEGVARPPERMVQLKGSQVPTHRRWSKENVIFLEFIHHF